MKRVRRILAIFSRLFVSNFLLSLFYCLVQRNENEHEAMITHEAMI